MTALDAERQLFKYLSESYTTTPIDSGSPGSFDIESTDEWIHWSLQEIREPATRKQNLRFDQVRLVVQAWNKQRSGVKPAKATAEAIAELMRHRVIEVTDLDEGGFNRIGYLSFFEPQITEMTNSTPGFQCVVVSILGVMQEIEAEAVGGMGEGG